jgi:hypothetical protein
MAGLFSNTYKIIDISTVSNHDKDITEDGVEVIDSVITNIRAFANIAGK